MSVAFARFGSSHFFPKDVHVCSKCIAPRRLVFDLSMLCRAPISPRCSGQAAKDHRSVLLNETRTSSLQRQDGFWKGKFGLWGEKVARFFLYMEVAEYTDLVNKENRYRKTCNSQATCPSWKCSSQDSRSKHTPLRLDLHPISVGILRLNWPLKRSKAVARPH